MNENIATIRLEGLPSAVLVDKHMYKKGALEVFLASASHAFICNTGSVRDTSWSSVKGGKSFGSAIAACTRAPTSLNSIIKLYYYYNEYIIRGPAYFPGQDGTIPEYKHT